MRLPREGLLGWEGEKVRLGLLKHLALSGPVGVRNRLRVRWHQYVERKSPHLRNRLPADAPLDWRVRLWEQRMRLRARLCHWRRVLRSGLPWNGTCFSQRRRYLYLRCFISLEPGLPELYRNQLRYHSLCRWPRRRVHLLVLRKLYLEKRAGDLRAGLRINGRSSGSKAELECPHLPVCRRGHLGAIRPQVCDQLHQLRLLNWENSDSWGVRVRWELSLGRGTLRPGLWLQIRRDQRIW